MLSILIIDDTPANITILKNILRSTYHISVASNCAYAMDIIRKDPPDMILFHVIMLEIDGYKVCQHLKNLKDTAKIPIIFISEEADIANEQKGLEMGAVDYITTPISPFITLVRIRNHIELIQMREHLEVLTEQATQFRRKVKELEARDRIIRFNIKRSEEKGRGQLLSLPMGRS